MNSEMEESRELADNRLIELQKLQQDLQTVQQENNNMEVDSFDFHLDNIILFNNVGTPLLRSIQATLKQRTLHCHVRLRE